MTTTANTHRDEILDAAERLLGRFGYSKMRVEDLAREAGVGKGTLYLYFDSKEAAVLSTVDRIVDTVCDQMELIHQAERPAADRLRDMLLARVLIRFDRVSAYHKGLNDLLSAIRTGLLERRQRHFAREMRILASTVAAGQECGDFVPGDANQFSRSLLLATNNFLPYALSAQELGNRRRLEQDVRGVVDLLVTALTLNTNSRRS